MNVLVGAGLLSLLFYLMIRLLSKLLSGGFQTRYGAYRQLAAKYRGKCESRGLADPPTVTFQHQDAQVRVGLAPLVPGQANTPRTRAVARFAQGVPLRLELYPRDRPSPPQHPRGTRDVALQIAEFDRLYAVQANDAEIAQELLRPDAVRASLEMLRQLCPPTGMLVSVNPERLLLQVDRNLGAHFLGLDALARSALLLHDCLRASVAQRLSEGIQVVAVGAGTAAPSGPPVCTICGEVVASSHVVCNRCRTPYHRDCWKFAGECATYGCKERAYTLVDSAPVVYTPAPAASLQPSSVPGADMRTFLLAEGRRIVLAQGDITLETTDAIVNAANSSLLGGGGVDGAIHAAGGPEILAECRKIREALPEGLPAGRAVVTTGGKLLARFVIHTVGPVYLNGNSGEPCTLASCYTESLALADQHQLTSIAFPAISTGAYGYPSHLAAGVAMDAVANALTGCRHVGLVRFVLFDAHTFRVFEQAAVSRLGEPVS